MARDTIEISAKAFYNIDNSFAGTSVNVAPIVGAVLAAMTNPVNSALGEGSQQLANDFGAAAGQSAMFPNSPPSEGSGEASVQPKSGINFVLYDESFCVVEENTGYLPVEDHIYAIQTLATDKLVMKQSGYLEIFVNNDAQTPVYYDNMTVTRSGGNVTEVNAYYPYGKIIRNLSISAMSDEYNGYKYNTKELQKELNLQWLDYGARMYEPVVGRFWIPDPLTEKYYQISPYAYCANNPINFIDPDGLTHYRIDENGNITPIIEVGAYDEGGHTLYMGRGEVFDLLFAADGSSIQINNHAIIPSLMNREKIDKKDDWGNPLYRSMYTGDQSSADDIFNTFVFAAKNTDKEWRFTTHKGSDGKSLFTVGTLNSEITVGSATDFGINVNDVRSNIHSHPGISSADEMTSMGYGINIVGDWQRVRDGDINYKSFVYMPNSGNVYKVTMPKPVNIMTLNNYNKSNWRMFR